MWVILAYMIASTVLVLTAGRLSDLFGRKRAYVGGFLVFALTSLGAGFAENGTELILWRIVQGVGAAFLFANAAALVTDAFPREQLGLAMGTNTMVAAVGLVLGPVLGGALVSISWHWVFWFNVPFALAGAAWGAAVLHELARRDTNRGLDLLGTATFVIGLTGLVLGVSKGGIAGWNDPVVIGGLVAGAVLLPLFVLIERHGRAPMLDLTIFENRLFAAATAAAFINGLSRFALLFVFVFYFQGAQGDDPITAGIKLAPMAIGMLIASPLAGMWADRHGSRTLAALGMLVSAVGLAAMTTLTVDSPYWQSSLWLLLVGVGSGMFNSPNTAAMMGAVPAEPPRGRRRRADDAAEHRRRVVDRVRDGDHHRRRAPGRAAPDLLRPRHRAVARAARAVHPQHAHRAVGARRDVGRRRVRVAAAALHAGACRKRCPRDRHRHRRCGSARSPSGSAPPRARSATTRRSGCSAAASARPAATAPTRRPTSSASRDALRFKQLLGLSLDELKALLEAEEARAALRAEWREGNPGAGRRREILEQALGHIERQLELVRRRRQDIDALEAELADKRAQCQAQAARAVARNGNGSLRRGFGWRWRLRAELLRLWRLIGAVGRTLSAGSRVSATATSAGGPRSQKLGTPNRASPQ